MSRAVETLWDEEEDLSPVDVGKVIGTAVASLGASQGALLAKLEESQGKLIDGLSASNAALVRAFAKALSTPASAPAAQWEFTIERDGSGLLKRVVARPVI